LAKVRCLSLTLPRFSTGKRSVERAREVLERGVPELQSAVERGEVSVSAAAEIVDLPSDEQREAVAEKTVAKKAKRARAKKKPSRKAARAAAFKAAEAARIAAATARAQELIDDIGIDVVRRLLAALDEPGVWEALGEEVRRRAMNGAAAGLNENTDRWVER
jgi:membrane protein involved in colicin uptake